MEYSWWELLSFLDGGNAGKFILTRQDESYFHGAISMLSFQFYSSASLTNNTKYRLHKIELYLLTFYWKRLF